MLIHSMLLTFGFYLGKIRSIFNLQLLALSEFRVEKEILIEI